MTWRNDDQDFFDQVSQHELTPPAPGACTLCDKRCGKCGLPVHQHTRAGLVECAWRGGKCTSCGCPPHPDDIATADSLTLHTPIAKSCQKYTHPADTYGDRELRRTTAWHRDAAGPFYVFKHCSHRHGQPEPAGRPA